MLMTNLIYPFIAGLVLGVFYFGGLWFTVQRLPHLDNPALWAFVSFSFRLMLVLIGFFIIMGRNWENAVAALVGFILIRVISIKKISIGKKKTSGNVIHHGN